MLLRLLCTRGKMTVSPIITNVDPNNPQQERRSRLNWFVFMFFPAWKTSVLNILLLDVGEFGCFCFLHLQKRNFPFGCDNGQRSEPVTLLNTSHHLVCTATTTAHKNCELGRIDLQTQPVFIVKYVKWTCYETKNASRQKSAKQKTQKTHVKNKIHQMCFGLQIIWLTLLP